MILTFWMDKRGAETFLGRVAVFLVVGAMAVSTARAEVVRAEAVLTTVVQETLDGTLASIDRREDVVVVGSTDLPQLTSASLTTTDLDGTLASLGQAFGTFSDPNRLAQANPEELGLEVACYSNASSVGYTVVSTAIESRQLVFSRPEVSFSVRNTQTIESSVFLSGAIVLWSTQPDRALDDMLGQITFAVSRDDTGEVLFATELIVEGEDAAIVTTTEGPLLFDPVGLAELADLGLDAATLAILEETQSVGMLHVLAIPAQEHVYQYTVLARETFGLTASLEVRGQTIPDGAGVAVTLGRPFANLATFIERGLPGVDGEAVERSINEATAKRAIGLVSQSTNTSGRNAGSLCGASGAEMVALMSLSFCGLIVRSTRRR